MAGPKLDKELFFRRLNRLYTSWKEHKESPYWGSAKSFCVLAGSSSGNESSYRKSAVVQMYLLGYLEFPETLMVFTSQKLYVVTGKKKYSMLADILSGNETSDVKLEILKRNKEGNQENYKILVDAIKSEGETVGMLLKENPIGDLVEGFKTALEEAKLTQVEVSKGIELATRVKEPQELELIKWAAALSSKVYKAKFIEDMETIIDEEKSVPQSKICNNIEEIMDEPSKLNLGLNADDIESCYAPIIQSGGTYDLRPSASTNDDPLKYDVIICSIGARYKGYCSNVARTYFIDPSKSMERAYDTLLKAQMVLIEKLRPGKRINRIVDQVRKTIESTSPKLIPRLTKNLGFGIGLEFRESTNLLNTKNTSIVEVGMAFNICMGFEGIPIPESHRKRNQPETYSVLLADTIVVTENENIIYTKVSKVWGKVHYDIDDANDSDEKESREPKSIHGEIDTTISGTRNQVLQSRLRDKQRQLEGKETDQERREKHQAELMKRKREEAVRRLKNQGKSKDTTERTEKNIIAYRSPSQYPKSLRDRQVFVDMEAEAVLIPINGAPMPFHISTIKSVSKSEEEKATYLRINFYTPGGSLGKDVSPAMQSMVTKHDQKMFIKEIGLRSSNAQNMNLQFRLIKELHKRVRQRELREIEESNLVIQEDLILTRDRRVPRLSDLSARPHLAGRKTQGTLEAHTNGLRFTSNKNEKLDILYANIKNAIFQPCDKELVVLIHFHLRNHIMIGKKKHRDVQFFTEVMEASQALDNRRRSMYDPDELDEENRERALRSKLNHTFKEFCKKVEASAERAQHTLTFDIPYRELGFQGTPYKEMVLLQPTVNCLVNLTENPFFIVSLDEIEHIHFERVMFSSRNFDMVVILKNFDIIPLRISAIPMNELESIKEWIDDIDLCFTTGTANLNWKSIMQTIKADDQFYMDEDEHGVSKPAGWEFLKMEGSDDDDDGEEEDQDSSFSADEVSEESDDSEGSDESDWDSIVEESSSEEVSEEEDAPSWDELEKEAAASDRMRNVEKRANEDSRRSKNSRPKKKRRS